MYGRTYVCMDFTPKSVLNILRNSFYWRRLQGQGLILLGAELVSETPKLFAKVKKIFRT